MGEKNKLKKYRVSTNFEITVDHGTFMARDEEHALEEAEKKARNWNPSLCFQCAEDMSIGEPIGVEAYLEEED
jgi:hypothetical protein